MLDKKCKNEYEITHEKSAIDTVLKNEYKYENNNLFDKLEIGTYLLTLWANSKRTQKFVNKLKEEV